MNSELQEQIASLIKAAKEAGSDAATFIQQQAPDVIEQLIRWQIVEGCAGVLAGTVLLIIAWTVFIRTRCAVDNGADETLWVPAGISILAALAFGCILLTNGFLDAGKAIFAPKLVVLEMVSQTVRK